ncbi:AsnC family transcriptional regulator [bacterium]|nr:MAG: AsnC family transcriptional regulator [bacterium]
MVKIHSISISPEMLSLIAEIDEFKGAWRALGKIAPERLNQLRRVATIESVGSSTRIEGVKLSDREIEALLGRLQSEPFTTRDEQEVVGYADVMEMIFENYTDIPLTENHLKQLHIMLLRHSDKDEWHRGNYKKHSNRVEAFDQDGQSIGVIFETTSPFDTPREMEELLAWYRQCHTQNALHPLIMVGIFTVVFLAIHPFQDGNGRLSRALTTLLLLQSGYAYVPYSSLESVIEQNKESYYLGLRRTQGTLKDESPDWSAWLMFFLNAMHKQKCRLETKVEREKVMQATLPELAVVLLGLVTEHGSISVGEAVRLTDAPRSTIKNHLVTLVDHGHLQLVGKGRGSRYIPA